MGVDIHCTAGLGRTGTIPGMLPGPRRDAESRTAVAKIRELRPGSSRRTEQVEAVIEFARRIRAA